MRSQDYVDLKEMICMHYHWNDIQILIIQSSGMYHNEDYPEHGGRRFF
jgi:hypothetical protein